MSGEQAAVDVEVRLKLVDAASARINSAAKSAEQNTQRAATATERAAQRAAEATERSATRQRSSHERLYAAREMLGVRAERAIQREIQQTEAAYNRLLRSGKLSWQEQAAAADKMRQKVAQLTNEMGRLTAAQKVQAGLRFGAAGMAGLTAAGYVLAGPAKAAMSYDRRLANMANTAYAERDAQGRVAGMKTLEAAINRARKQGGGTREQAAEALDTMIASGVVSEQDAIKMLPGIMKAATASNTDANALATIAIRAQQSFKIGADDIPAVLSAALAAGQAGGFELKDMAKWLPQQMAMASNLGITGKEGFAKLAAWNQAAIITAGGKDEAGNNLRDLLNELNTPHFKQFLAQQYLNHGARLKAGQRLSQTQAIDQMYLDYQNRGIDKVSATLDIMDKSFAKNRRYQDLQGQLGRLDPKDAEGRRQILEAMAAQVQGSEIGKVFHNQQSLMAFLGLLNNKQYTQDVLGKVRAEYTAPGDKLQTSLGYGVVAGTADFKLEQAGEEKKTAEKAALDSVTPAIGKAASAFGDLAAKFPALTGSIVLATAGLGALAGTAGLAALAMGGNAGAGVAGGAVGRIAARFGAIPGAGRVAGLAARGLKVGTLAGVGSMAGEWALEKAFGEESAVTRYGSSALNSAALGATLGSIIPGVGTAIGAGVGAVGGLAWEGIKDLLKPSPTEQKPAEVNAKLQIGLDPRLVLQSQSMQTNGVNARVEAGNVFYGVPAG